jgi:hypothetical protein
MTQTFTRSGRVIRQLAEDGARTPPADDDAPVDYVDKCLTILGSACDIRDQSARRERVLEREFVASEFRGLDRRLVEFDRRLVEFEKRTDQRFQKMEDTMDRGFQGVEVTMDRQFEELGDTMDRRFQEVEDKMDQRFQEVEDTMDRRFQELEDTMDRGLQEVEDTMDRGFQELENKMDGKLRQQLGHLQKASRNALRTRGWEEIYPVGPLDDHGRACIPRYFPRTVKLFWKLKMPRECEFETLAYHEDLYY